MDHTIKYIYILRIDVMDFLETVTLHSTPKTIELAIVNEDLMLALHNHCDREYEIQTLQNHYDTIYIAIDLYQSGNITFGDMLHIVQSKSIPTHTTQNANTDNFINYMHIIKSLHNTIAHEKIFNAMISEIYSITKTENRTLYDEIHNNI